MKINVNKVDVSHNTSKRTGSIIKYICVHYVGAVGSAEGNIEYYSRPTTKEASADFYVGHKGEVWQYNPDPAKRYCWAVGGGRQSVYGGTLHGIVKNHNSVSIEMCVKTRGNKTQANHKDWYFTKETVDATVELVKYLMKLYGVPADRVVRHFDVTGKLCPGVIGWNYPSGSEDAWVDFKTRIGGTHTPTKQKEVHTVNVKLPVLMKGSVGQAVKSLQTLLNANGFDCGKVDGSFGNATDAALRKFQKTNGMTVDGKCGPQVYGCFWTV